MRLVLLAALACAGCFDFDALTECTASNALVCENFETGTVRDLWFTNAGGSATGAVDTSRPHAGHDALHIHASAPSGDTWNLQWTKLDESITTDAYVRAFIFAPTAPSGTVSLLNMIEPSTPYEGLRIYYEPSGTLRIHNGVSAPEAASTSPLPTNRWTCIEWYLHEDTAGASTLWIDDVEAASISGANTIPAMRLGKVSVGAVNQTALSASAGWDVWIDDIVIDNHRITCRQ